MTFDEGPMGKRVGASLRETGSRPLGQAATRLVASRIDPARKCARGPQEFDRARYTASLMVPATLPELLGELARFESDYDLREYIDGLAENPSDGLIWRDCIEVANAIAIEARRAAE